MVTSKVCEISMLESRLETCLADHFQRTIGSSCFSQIDNRRFFGHKIVIFEFIEQFFFLFLKKLSYNAHFLRVSKWL